MKKPIVGATVGTTLSPKKIKDELNGAYVKKTDYASVTEGGVVRIDDRYMSFGLRVLRDDSTDGILDVCAANKNVIDNRKQADNVNPLGAASPTNRHPIVPGTLDYAVKAALSDCRITWTDEERFAALKLLGIIDSSFTEIESVKETVTLPSNAWRYAQILEIHGSHSKYFAYQGGIFEPVRNYPARLVTDQGRVLFEMPEDVLTRLTDFGYLGNYIYFDQGKAFYHQASRAYNPHANGFSDANYYNPPLEDGEEVIDRIDYTMLIIKLAAPVITDISDYITTDGIIDIGDAESIIAPSLVSEEEVRALSPYDYYNYYFPTVKILVETYGGNA